MAVLALAMKLFGRSSVESTGAAPEDSARSAVDALLDEIASGGDEVAALSSDGVAFVPSGDAVHLIPSGESEEGITLRSPGTTGTEPEGERMHAAPARDVPVNPKTGRRLPGWSPSQRLVPGDLIGARVVRGAPDFDPWRLETLGRDGDYMAWPFETEDAAHAALELLEARIVRVPEDEDGNPRPPSSADYVEARRLDEETERALDAPDDAP